MSSADDLARSFSELSVELLSARRDRPAPSAIVEHAVTVVPGVDQASLTVTGRRGKGFATVAATDRDAEVCDELQYSRGAGPCVAAVTHGGAHLSDDLAADPRWHGWGAAAAAETGLRSALSVGLVDGDRTLAALNLYATRPGALGRDRTASTASLYARYATGAYSAARQVDELEVALESRHVIGVAQGILMERFDLSTEGAFRVLQRYSSTSNVKLRDVADQVVRTRALPPDMGVGTPPS